MAALDGVCMAAVVAAAAAPRCAVSDGSGALFGSADAQQPHVRSLVSQSAPPRLDNFTRLSALINGRLRKRN